MSCFTVTDGDSTCFIQQQRINITGSLYRFTRFSNHVGTERAVHTGNTDSRKKSTDSCRNQTHKQRNKRSNSDDRITIVGKRFQGNTHNDKNKRKTCQQNSQRNLVRGFLTGSTFHQCNHLIKKTFSRLSSHHYFYMIGQYLRATRYGTLVATCLTNNRSRLAGDSTFINRSQAFNNLTIGRNHVSRLTNKHISFLQLRRTDGNNFIAFHFLCRCLFTSLTQAVGLCFTTCFGNSFGKIGKQQGYKQNDKHGNIVSKRTL